MIQLRCTKKLFARLPIDASTSITDLSAYRTSVWLADRPCNVKGSKDFVWPMKAMLALLDQLSRKSE